MSKILKIIRSIVTSFLFICLIFLLSLSLFIIFFRTNKIPLSNNIDREELVELVVPNYTLDEKEIYIDYINDVIRYVFHERSYPTIDYERYKNFENSTTIYKNLESLKKEMDLDYSQILTLRKICSFVENNSVCLILGFLVIFITLIVCIEYFNFEVSVKFISLGLIVSSIISCATILYFKYLLNHNYWILPYQNVFLGKNQQLIYLIVLIYFILGIIPFILNYFYNNLKSKNKLAFFK